MLHNQRAVVLFSGGQDSTTCLAWALENYDEVETVGFQYGQRHSVEMDCRKTVRASIQAMKNSWASRLGEDHVLDLAILGAMSETALTSGSEISMTAEGLPTTFVPGRNLVFLTFASILAYRRDAKHIVTGVCETDYSGYPDCRDDTIKALQIAINLGTQRRFILETPLMWIDKAETWRLAQALGGAELVRCIVDETHTCYLGDRTKRHQWGYGCGECPACVLRAQGFEKFVTAA